jgi:tetratricopeptide (TPR) repeat protein
MGIDYRPDHSFRIPRPELSLDLRDTPNACSRCHVDKTAQWSVDAMAKWYGRKKRPHYGTILAAGRAVDPAALQELKDLAKDRLYPDIVRATALRLLANYPGAEAADTFTGALADEAALLRHTAVRNLPETDPNRRRHNLGNLYHRLGKIDQAIGEYRKAISIDDQFYPAKVNLANLYNQRGRNEAAEQLLQQVLAAHPDLHAVKYSLGLLLAEMGRADQAADYLRQAAEAMPQRHRIRYNLGLLRQHLGQDAAAETELQAALALAPDNPDYLYALAVFYFQRRRWDAAEKMARHLAAGAAAKDQAGQLLEAIQKARQASDNSPRRP